MIAIPIVLFALAWINVVICLFDGNLVLAGASVLFAVAMVFLAFWVHSDQAKIPQHRRA